jgi:oligosaccharide repeat unit polymerase
MIQAVGYAILGLATFYLGYFGLKRQTYPRIQRIETAYYLSKAKVFYAVFVLSAIGLISFLILEFSGGGVLVRIGSPSQRVALLQGYGYVFWGIEMFMVAGLIWYGYMQGKPDIGCILYLLMTSLVLASFANRARVVMLWLTILIVSQLMGRRIKPLQIGVAIGGLFVFSIGFIVVRQNIVEAKDLSIDLIVGDSNSWLFYLMHIFVTFENFMALLNVTPALLHFDYGFNLIQPLLQSIPRFLWPDKPGEAGSLLSLIMYPDSTGSTPFTFLGNLYLSFGVVGIFVGMFAVGLVLRVFYDYVNERVNRVDLTIVYGVALSYLFLLLSGINITAIVDFIQIALPVLIIMRWVKTN